MSFDAWIVGFGLARTIIELRLLAASGAYCIWAGVIMFDLYLLYGYFVLGRMHPSMGSTAPSQLGEPVAVSR